MWCNTAKSDAIPYEYMKNEVGPAIRRTRLALIAGGKSADHPRSQNGKVK